MTGWAHIGNRGETHTSWKKTKIAHNILQVWDTEQVHLLRQEAWIKLPIKRRAGQSDQLLIPRMLLWKRPRFNQTTLKISQSSLTPQFGRSPSFSITTIFHPWQWLQMYTWMNGSGCNKSQGPVAVNCVNHQQRACVQHLHPPKHLGELSIHGTLVQTQLRGKKEIKSMPQYSARRKKETLTLNEQNEDKDTATSSLHLHFSMKESPLKIINLGCKNQLANAAADEIIFFSYLLSQRLKIHQYIV